MSLMGGERSTVDVQTTKVCPICGYMGGEAHCPLDGEAMVAPAKDESPTVPMEWENGRPRPSARHGEWAEPDLPDDRARSLSGQTLDGRFEVGGELGRGGMGRVYEAFQPAIERTVAIKVLSRGFSEDPEAVKRFHREALAASRLNHPNTIAIHDFGQSDGWLFMVMERLDGLDLAETLREAGPFDPRRALAIALQVARALGAAHAQGVIHRDLKPANIFLCTVDGNPDFVKVLDFGVAKIVTDGADATQMTKAGAFFGTPQYMAPEQATDEPIDGRADVYALGVLLYEMLMGRPPFMGENPLQIMLAQAHDAPPRFDALEPGFTGPDELEAVIFQALSKGREDRQESVSLVERQLVALQAIVDDPSAEVPGHDLFPTPLETWDPAKAGLSDQGTDAVGSSQTGTPVARASAQRWVWPVLALLSALVLWFVQDVSTPSPSIRNQARPMVGAASENTAQGPKKTAQPSQETGQPLAKADPSRVFQSPFAVGSVPAGAELVHVVTGVVEGRTPVSLAVVEAAVYRLQKKGFVPKEIRLDPGGSERKFLYTLDPTPTSKAGPARPSSPRVSRRAAPALEVPEPAVAKPAADMKPVGPRAPEQDVPLEME